jgi:hypothetical protein
MNTYRAVQIDAGTWTVEWAASGLVLGHVFGTFGTQKMALLGAFEMARWELLDSLLRMNTLGSSCGVFHRSCPPSA